MRAWPGRVLAGVIVGLLVLALPSVRGARPSSAVPSIVEFPVMPPPQILACRRGESTVVSPPRRARPRQGLRGLHPRTAPPQGCPSRKPEPFEMLDIDSLRDHL